MVQFFSSSISTPWFASLVAKLTNVISFLVSVPVLSEQITVIAPNVSTVGRFLTIACFFAIRLTPEDKIIVKIEGSPSGIEDTIKAMTAVAI